MRPGKFVLDLLQEVPTSGRTILFIRHSKRDSFSGVPDHLRPGAEITPEGIQMALEFGKSLQQFFSGRRLVLGHTIAHRCHMTADFIGKGYSPEGNFKMIDYQQEIEDPIVDSDAYIALREERGWHEIVINWLNNEIPRNIMSDPHIYADIHLKKLVSFEGINNRELFIVIGHDYTLFPLVLHFFGKMVTEIDFLNGLVINVDTNRAEIWFSDAECSMRKIIPGLAFSNQMI